MTTTGAMRDRLTLQQQSAATSDAYGQNVRSWTTVATVWANVRPLTARELTNARQTGSVADYAIEIRYRSDVTAEWRGVTEDGAVLNFDGTPNPDGKKRFMVITAKRQATGAQ